MKKHLLVAETIARLLFGMVLVVVFFIPFYWMALTALKTQGQTLIFPPTFWVNNPQWENFHHAFNAVPFVKYLLNSIIVTAAILSMQFLTIIPAAFSFARYNFKGKNLIFFIILSSMMIPAQLVFLPVFLILSKLQLINSYWSLVLPSASSAFGIFMLRQTFRQVPEELLEAARLDKAGEIQILTKIMLPLARPTLVTLGLLVFISSWNDYFWPLVLTTNDTVRTLPLGIASLRMVEGGIAYHTVMAGNLVLVAPIVVIFLIAQRYVIRSFTYLGDK